MTVSTLEFHQPGLSRRTFRLLLWFALLPATNPGSLWATELPNHEPTQELVSSAKETGAANDELSRTTWKLPTHDEVKLQLERWLEETEVPAEVAELIRERWYEPIEASERLNLLADAFLQADEAARELIDFCRTTDPTAVLPQFEVFTRSNTLPFERDQLRLLYGRWLAQNQLFDETLEQIGSLQPDEVVDPASLLFYQAIAYHRLRNKDACLPILERLLENEATLPRRYSTLAQLMQADIAPLKADSLDEVSRLMDSIKVRLGHARAGKRVRTEEEDVIAKLDKMIKKLEDQAQSAAAAAAAAGQAGDAANPAAPMSDSVPGGVRGPGNVDPKQLKKEGDWGDLPARERESSLQQLGKDFPSHYRDVIEEYFRKVAREGAEP